MGEKIPKALGDFLGQEQVKAYSQAFGAEIIDGYNDQGKDLKIDNPEIPAVQIKSSVEGVKKFLVESLKQGDFIPVCVGEPGTKDEMFASIKQFGAWIGQDIANRDKLFNSIAKIRDLCSNKKRDPRQMLADLS
ncbi:MAG: hypothetical protein COX02_02605 [Candidatus Vogelbacteria bacterium CG22_combo_CG10-13_8_21_14_all_37_9]|uniref:Uncharacterized protein n=1 Tax=Candidatus Vogelbacteria bacterium CG22_combo_CG10-13_8_21_14_all_37_9 TaxID=1975046 RepID=A0A2H0BKF0_9BACT|nr:MAG: hypothetical protein COX02_02605 [Candidatus Vogelbacteria bacterium CG22_combo_CG10-13_8_21_14_all_37_9]